MYAEGTGDMRAGDQVRPEQEDDRIGEDDLADPVFVQLLEEQHGGPGELDLYAVLGVGREASESEIRSAYKRLSRLLHPDKRELTSTVTTEDTQTIFTRLSLAYSVLVDPSKRCLYDMYGLRGVEMEGLELAVRDKSPALLRAEYLLQRAQDREKMRLAAAQSDTRVSLGVDLTQLFDHYLQVAPSERLQDPLMRISQCTLGHSVLLAHTMRHKVDLTGFVVSQKGIGLGGAKAVWMYRVPSTFSWMNSTQLINELGHGQAGHDLFWKTKLRNRFTKQITGFADFSCGYRRKIDRILLLPSVGCGTDVELSSNLVARLKLNYLANGGVHTDLHWRTQDGRSTLSFGMFVQMTGNAGCSLNWTRVVDWHLLSLPSGAGLVGFADEKEEQPSWAEEESAEQVADSSKKFGQLRLGLETSLHDIASVEAGMRCCLSTFTSLDFSLSVGMQKGVLLNITLIRDSTHFSVPVHLSTEPNPLAMGYGAFVPLFTIAVMRYLLYEPWLNSELDKAERMRRKKMSEELGRRQREALCVQSLMQTAAFRSKEREQRSGGLVVLKAVFGQLNVETPLSSVPTDEGGSRVVEVTVPLQAMIESSRLILPPSKFSDMQGFYDPCAGLLPRPPAQEIKRELAISYLFQGKKHFTRVAERSGLAVPMAKHLVCDE